MRLLAAIAIAGALASIAGQVGAQAPIGEIRGVVRDLERVPVPNVDIQIRKIDRVPVIRVRSAADGSFRVLNLTPGVYRVIASASGFKTATDERVQLLPEHSATVLITLERSGTCRLGEVAGMGHIAGTVTDWTGDRVPAYITLKREGADAPERAMSAKLDGRYEIDLVPPGQYSLHVWIPSAPPVVSEIEVGPDQRLTVDARLVLPPQSSRSTAPVGAAAPSAASLLSGFGGIHGRVTDHGGGTIPGATATVESSAGRTLQTTTNQNGVFTLPNLQPGRYNLRVSLSGFKTYSVTVTVSPGRWSNGSATLEIGEISHPDSLDRRWNLRRSESLAGIRTRFGDITLATVANDFFACVERGAYSPGKLELVAPFASTPQVLRMHHGSRHPAAPDAKVYGLTIDGRPELVVTNPTSGQLDAVEGRVVEGFDVIERIRQSLTPSTDQPPAVEIISISRLIRL